MPVEWDVQLWSNKNFHCAKQLGLAWHLGREGRAWIKHTSLLKSDSFLFSKILTQCYDSGQDNTVTSNLKRFFQRRKIRVPKWITVWSLSKSISDTYQIAFHVEVIFYKFALLVFLHFSTSYLYVHTSVKKSHLNST